jgi:hypothetical protein
VDEATNNPYARTKRRRCARVLNHIPGRSRGPTSQGQGR